MAELKARWRELSQRFDVRSDNAAFTRSVAQPAARGHAGVPASGFGLQQPSASDAAELVHPQPARSQPTLPKPTQAAPAQPAAKKPVSQDVATQAVRGVKLEKKINAPLPTATLTSTLTTLSALLALMGLGGLWQARRVMPTPHPAMHMRLSAN